MPRPRSSAPAYQFHVSGNAKVRLAGKDFYLGPHGSPESYARYHSLLAEYNANGKRIPEDIPTHQFDDAIRVKQVTAEYRRRELPRYEHNNGSHARLRGVLDLLDRLHGAVEVDQFGPLKLESIRDELIKTGNCRKYINQQVRDIVRIFRFGVSRELVKSPTGAALQALDALRPDQVHDNAPRQPVRIKTVKATMPRLSPTVAAMVRIQVATGCRPSELFSMTPNQIVRTGSTWVYRPDHHKTKRHGKAKAIPLIGDAVEALSPFMFGARDELCFQTPKGTAWNKDTYRRHITRAAKAAGVEHWTSYQIRHTVGQAVLSVYQKMGAAHSHRTCVVPHD